MGSASTWGVPSERQWEGWSQADSIWAESRSGQVRSVHAGWAEQSGAEQSRTRQTQEQAGRQAGSKEKPAACLVVYSYVGHLIDIISPPQRTRYNDPSWRFLLLQHSQFAWLVWAEENIVSRCHTLSVCGDRWHAHVYRSTHYLWSTVLLPPSLAPVTCWQHKEEMIWVNWSRVQINDLNKEGFVLSGIVSVFMNEDCQLRFSLYSGTTRCQNRILFSSHVV